MLTIKILEEMKKVKGVFRLKCPVFKREKLFPVRLLVIYNEIVRSVIHEMEQFSCFVYDRFPLSPGKNCCPKTRNLDILL